MKRFQTKKRKKYTWLILFIIFLFLFTFISFFNFSHDIDNKMFYFFYAKTDFNIINNYLDKMIFNYTFKKQNNLFNPKSDNNILKLYGDDELLLSLNTNLKKLGIESVKDNNYICKISIGNNNEIISIKNKEYAMINMTLPTYLSNQEELIRNKYQKYLEDIKIDNDCIIEIGSSQSNKNHLKTSTEIVSLILYDILGD